MDNTLDEATKILKMLANPIRIRIILALTDQPSVNVSSLVESLGLEQSLASHYLGQMETLGMLKSTRKRTQVYYSVTDQVFNQVIQIMFKSKANQ